MFAYPLSLSNDFEPNLNSECSKNFILDSEMSDTGNKTAVQRIVILKRKLGLIVQFVGSFLQNGSKKKAKF